MITANNYYNQINSIGVHQLPPTLLKSHELVNKVTQEGASWETYNGNSTIKRMIDLYISKLNEYVEQNPPKKPSNSVKKEIPKREPKATQSKVNTTTKAKPKPTKKVDTANQVEHIEDELKFIKRFTLLNGICSPRCSGFRGFTPRRICCSFFLPCAASSRQSSTRGSRTICSDSGSLRWAWALSSISSRN